MSKHLPTVYLSGRVETAWSLTGQHTPLIDLAFTDRVSTPPGNPVSISRD
jgi:hypothetical protein